MALSFKNVSMLYGSVYAIKDITFDIDEGEFVFLVGPSGAGKTTILKLLFRQDKPTSGVIEFFGLDVNRIRNGGLPFFRREIGFVYQDFKLLQKRTVYENIALALEVTNRSNAFIKDAVASVLDMVELKDKNNSFPYQLSGGEKQRVAIARAMANSPRLLIADEPTGNLDPGMQWDIIQLLNKINNYGTTVLMATHASDVVDSMQKRVIALNGGMIIRDSKGGYEV